MQFAHKVRKLFSPDLFASAWEHASRLLHPVNAKGILATIDRQKLSALREKYPYKSTSPRINRFEDAEYWVPINVERAQDLWLDRAPPLAILDLGCGAGFFLYVCRLFGHDALGLDTDNEPLFRGTTEVLDVRRFIASIERNVPLPDLHQRFELVTGHRVCFHRIRQGENGEPTEWSTDDWKFFIDDIRTRFLKPNGRLLLDFNPRRDGSSFFTPELYSSFKSQGARIFRSKALFAADPHQRPRFKQTKR